MLLDVNLPDTTGRDVRRQLRVAVSDVPGVVLSAAPLNPTWVQEFRPVEVWCKPFSINALLRLIRVACRAATLQEVHPS